MQPRFALVLAGLTLVAAGPLLLAQGGAKADQVERDEVRKSAQAFTKAFERGDAKAIAAFWTENGEYHSDGLAVRGREAIEKMFAGHFKDHPSSKVDVMIESIRFPSANLAIEEGFVRQIGDGKALPTTTLYSVTHVREGGVWKIAVAREWGSGQDRLADLDWLVGVWKGTIKDQEIVLTFAWDAKKPFLMGEFSKSVKDKIIASGTMKIGVDPQRPGQLRSWHFDDDGGHGQALWFREGNRWLLDSIGVSAGGKDIASVNVLGRVGTDAFTWRSIDRVAAGQELPDTIPVKLSRVTTR